MNIHWTMQLEDVALESLFLIEKIPPLFFFLASNAAVVNTFDRHSGQLTFCSSHSSMHNPWKECEHGNRCLASTSCFDSTDSLWYSSLQIEQDAASSWPNGQGHDTKGKKSEWMPGRLMPSSNLLCILLNRVRMEYRKVRKFSGHCLRDWSNVCKNWQNSSLVNRTGWWWARGGEEDRCARANVKMSVANLWWVFIVRILLGSINCNKHNNSTVPTKLSSMAHTRANNRL